MEPRALVDLEHASVVAGLQIWTSLRGQRAMTAKSEIHPRHFGRHLKHVSLVKIIDGRRDFHIRILGDAIVGGFKIPLLGARWSELVTQMPREAELFGAQYRAVMHTATPQAWRFYIGDDLSMPQFSVAEIVRMPLGDGRTVDHILSFIGFLDASAWEGCKQT